MRLLSLPSLGWPIPKKKGSQGAGGGYKAILCPSCFKLISQQGKKRQNPSYITFQYRSSPLVRKPIWEELESICGSQLPSHSQWALSVLALLPSVPAHWGLLVWVPCVPPLYTGLERGSSASVLGCPGLQMVPTLSHLGGVHVSARASQSLRSRYPWL